MLGGHSPCPTTTRRSRGFRTCSRPRELASRRKARGHGAKFANRPAGAMAWEVMQRAAVGHFARLQEALAACAPEARAHC